jgi:tRNA pseudouridine65 synthase
VVNAVTGVPRDPGVALPILYVDDTLVVVDKPPGLLVHRSPIDRRETRFAVQLLRDQLGRRVYPVHRLDKGTSGALVFALGREAAAVLAGAFAGQQVHKTYHAIVRGWPAASGVIEHPLEVVRDPYVPAATVTQPKPARTSFRSLATVELPHRVDRYPTARYAHLELRPDSGRRHQLRRHLAHVSHPIIGDSTYGKGRHNRLFAEQFGVRRLLLACVRLEFDHPVSGVPLAIGTGPGAGYTELLERLDWRPTPPVEPELSPPLPWPSP